MNTLSGRTVVASALLWACLVSSVRGQALNSAPYPVPPPAPLPPANQPFQILTPPGFTRPPVGPVIAPAPRMTPLPFIPPPQTVTAPPLNTGQLTALSWDSEQKEANPKPGDVSANFTFWFTNTSPEAVVINAVRTSCGCTVAKLVATPWHVVPGTNGPIEVSVDLRGKSGSIVKAVTVETSAGIKSLIVKMNIPVATAPAPAMDFTLNHPTMGDAERLKNMQDSLKDRQVVFKDAKCAECHAKPALNQVDGSVIYRGVCATCHDSPLRAAAVTDLKALKHETDLDYWKQWIANGREGTMMPAYAQAHGGPLNEFQINALAAYCFNTFRPVTGNATTTPASPASPAATTNASISLPAVSVFPLPKAKQ